MFTEQDSARQDAAFAELKEEFSRLEQQEKDLRKAAGLPEEGDVQLAEADISLRDINLVKASFKRYLQQIYHARIAYPTRKKPAESAASRRLAPTAENRTRLTRRLCQFTE